MKTNTWKHLTVQQTARFVRVSELKPAETGRLRVFRALRKNGSRALQRGLFTRSFAFCLLCLIMFFSQDFEAMAHVTLEWQPVMDSNVTTYNVFIREEGESYDSEAVYWSGPETSCTLEVPDQERIYYFAVRAVSETGVQSAFSNEVCYGCTFCPDDSDKIYAGACGCGIPDTDIDVDGIWDCYDADDDNDGIEDLVEDSGPNQGDSNRDGIPDSQQPNVGGIMIGGELIYIAVESIDQKHFSHFQSVDNPAPEESPPNIDFAFGVFACDLRFLELGESVTVTMILPEDTTPDTYYMYGSTPDNETAHWYEFIYDGETGAEIDGNVITLFLDPAGEGDHTPIRDNEVVALGVGGPGFLRDDTDSPGDPDRQTAPGKNIMIESGGCFMERLFP